MASKSFPRKVKVNNVKNSIIKHCVTLHFINEPDLEIKKNELGKTVSTEAVKEKKPKSKKSVSGLDSVKKIMEKAKSNGIKFSKDDLNIHSIN